MKSPAKDHSGPMPLLLVIDLVLGSGATVTQIGDAVEG
jgi:hypothetical protein